MELFERANPIPDPDTYVVDPDPDRAMQADPYRVATIAIDSATEPPSAPRRRWLLPAIAAATIALVVGGLVVFLPEDETTPSDKPSTTTPPTTAPPTTQPSIAPSTGSAVIDGFFDAYNAGDLDAVLATITDDAVISEVYDGAEPNPDGPLIQAPQQHLGWKLTRGESLGEPTCVAATPRSADAMSMRCEYVTDGLLQVPAGTPIPTRTLFTIADGKISEIHQGYGDPTYSSHEFTFGRWLFRDYPDMWAALFGAINSNEEAAEQGQLRAQWFERLTDECRGAPFDHGVCGTWGDDPVISGEEYHQFQRELESIQWTSKDGGGYSRADCDPHFVYYFEPTGGTAQGLNLFGFLHERAGFADLYGQALPGTSPTQARIALDQITDSISCYRTEGIVQIEELPPSIPAHGFIIDDDYSIFAVTDPRGGLAWMHLRDGLVTPEIVAELAEVAVTLLADVIP